MDGFSAGPDAEAVVPPRAASAGVQHGQAPGGPLSNVERDAWAELNRVRRPGSMSAIERCPTAPEVSRHLLPDTAGAIALWSNGII